MRARRRAPLTLLDGTNLDSAGRWPRDASFAMAKQASRASEHGCLLRSEEAYAPVMGSLPQRPENEQPNQGAVCGRMHPACAVRVRSASNPSLPTRRVATRPMHRNPSSRAGSRRFGRPPEASCIQPHFYRGDRFRLAFLSPFSEFCGPFAVPNHGASLANGAIAAPQAAFHLASSFLSGCGLPHQEPRSRRFLRMVQRR
jgi:hypothetical protein